MEKIKRGYLNEDYHLFHIKDKRELETGYHYHEFDKIVVFLSGKVSYAVEGRTYFLKPWDVMLIRHDQLHSTKIDGRFIYERMILYLTPEFLQREGLYDCFERSSGSNISLFRADEKTRLLLMKHLSEAEENIGSALFGAKIMERTNILQLLVAINRAFSPEKTEKSAMLSDPKTDEVIKYIKENLEKDLSAEALCARFFVSRSWMMESFKRATGYTLHAYITQKRLMLGADLIKNGESVQNACDACGFTDYTAFLRAFKRMFGTTPKTFGK